MQHTLELYIRHEFLTLIVSMARFFVKIIISKVADSRFLITFSNVYFWQAAFKNETAVSEYQRKKYSQFNTLMGVSLQNFQPIECTQNYDLRKYNLVNRYVHVLNNLTFQVKGFIFQLCYLLK